MENQHNVIYCGEVMQQMFLQLVMDNLQECIFWKDVNSVYLGCNHKFAEIAGLDSPEQIVGKTDHDLPWKKEEADFFRLCDRRVMDSNTPEIGIIEPQLQADGKQAWLETNKLPLHDDQGHVIGILGTFQDITERKQAELALQQLNTELESRVAERTLELQSALNQLQRTQLQMVQTEKMSALGQMVAGILHEINNPVNYIYGNLKHLNDYVHSLLSLIQGYRQHYPKPPEALQDSIAKLDLDFLIEDIQKLLKSAEKGAGRIKEIVQSLRNFSRLDESERKEVNLHIGLDNTLKLLQHRLKTTRHRQKITVLRDYGNLPLIECYPSLLNQAFINLLNNAIDALEDHPVEQKTIRIWTKSVGKEWVSIHIADNGTGISEAVQSRIFDPFFTTKPVGKGTGLGLSISYQIITGQHHGRLYYHSTMGEGTEFVIELPIQLYFD